MASAPDDRELSYLLGDLDQAEKELVEAAWRLHPERLAVVSQLEAIAAAMTLTHSPPPPFGPTPDLQARLLTAVANRLPSAVTTAFAPLPEHAADTPIVIAGLDRMVRWVSPAFCSLCGYSGDELRGRRLGPLLQGPLTDQHAVGVLREAIHHFEPVTQHLVNYEKNGTPYLVSINIRVAFAPDGSPQAYVAFEHRLPATPPPDLSTATPSLNRIDSPTIGAMFPIVYDTHGGCGH